MAMMQDTNANPKHVFDFGFKGTGGAYFGSMIVPFIFCILTLGLYYPWAKARQMQFLSSHTAFEGKPFAFHGTGREMFRGFIKAVILLSIVYGGFIIAIIQHYPVAGMVWLGSGLLLLTPLAIHGSYKYRMSRTSWQGIHFSYPGDLRTLLLLFLKGFLFTVLSLGIYGAWFRMQLRSFIVRNIRFGQAVFHYTGQGGDYFLLNLKGYFLTIFTAGIYFFWWQKDLLHYYINHLRVQHHERSLHFRCTATTGDVFSLIAGNILLLVFTLGIGYPWVITRTLRLLFSKIEITGDLDPATLASNGQSAADATGEELTGLLDLGFVI